MSPIRYLDKLEPFALIVLCVAFARFLLPILTFGVFSFTLALYILLRYDSRLFIGTAIFMLILSAGFLLTGSSAGANEIAIIAYYFLVVGALGLLIEYLMERNETSKKNGGEKSNGKAPPIV